MSDETAKNENAKTNQSPKQPSLQKPQKETPPPKPDVDWLQLIDVTESFKKEPIDHKAPFDFLKRNDSKE